MDHQHHRKLYRSTTNKIIGGICGGLADYINVDASIIRLVWTLVVVFTGFVPGILVYIVALFVIPTRQQQ